MTGIRAMQVLSDPHIKEFILRRFLFVSEVCVEFFHLDRLEIDVKIPLWIGILTLGIYRGHVRRHLHAELPAELPIGACIEVINIYHG